MELVVNLYEAKTNLSKYVKLLENKEVDKVVVMKNGNKIVQFTLIKDLDKVRVGAGHKYAPTMDFDLKNEVFSGLSDLFGY